jgi:hypothetical protein
MTKNSVYGPAERSIYVGPNFQIAARRVYGNIGIHARKEWNKQEITGQADHYNWDVNIEPTWMVPFSAGKVHFVYSGIAELNTAKGADSFGKPTVNEFMTRNSVTVDVGALLFHQPELLTANAGVRCWHNEFGKPSSDPGGEEMAPIFGVSLHLGRE